MDMELNCGKCGKEDEYICPHCKICSNCEGSCELCELTARVHPDFTEITKGVALYLLNQVKRLIQMKEVLVHFLCNEADDGHFWMLEEPIKGCEALFILDPRGYLVVSAIHEALHVLYPALEHEDLAYLAIQVADRLSEDQIYNFLVDILEKMERK